MRITAIHPLPVQGHRPHLLLLVETDEGITGLGEAGIVSRAAAVYAALDHYRPLLIGQDPFRTEHLWQLLFRGGFFPAGRELCSTIAAIDIALWDIKGKALGVPVHTLLGGPVRDSVPCYTHVPPGKDVATTCRDLVAQGWHTLRLALPTPTPFSPTQAVRAALATFTSAREAVGDDTDLIIDVHTRLDPPEAARLCRELEPLHPLFVEDPLRSENLTSYRNLRHHTAVPLAAGEQLTTKWEFRPLIEEELIDYARVDVCIAGGLTESRKIAAWCETHHIRLALHNPLGPVSTAAALHLALASPTATLQEQPRRPDTLLPGIITGQPTWDAGSLLPTTAPGLGLTIDLAAARAARPERWPEPPRLTLADGSFTNW
jgi:L-alanine-DL-glutamate epimerase-like enolase superfamily enzyme